MEIDYSSVLIELSRKGVNFVVVGGFASIAHGVVRVTMDLDLVLDTAGENLALAWNALSQLGFIPRQPVDQQTFENPHILLALLKEKDAKALTFYNKNKPFLIVDLLFGEDFLIGTADKLILNIFGVSCAVVSKQKLIQLKEKANREKDRVDIKALRNLE